MSHLRNCIAAVMASKDEAPDAAHEAQLPQSVRQEFEKAAQLRDKIKALKENQKHIDSLKKQMEEAVKNQEFEKAAELRDKIKSCQN